MIVLVKMGGACCKKDSPASPHIPVCEVLRRCARQICPLDPPVQKSVPRTRKYGLSDIVGPVVKKDSWAQTDPLPPPRRKRRKEKKEKRKKSRSMEFLPHLLKESIGSTGSLGDISGQEDAIDFQMYIMSRLPQKSETSPDEGKEALIGRKRVFLSGLLGEENNNLTFLNKSLFSGTESCPEFGTKQELSPQEAISRRSSISESLKEFESSLLDMLQDVGEDEEDTNSIHLENQMFPPLQLKAKEGELPSVKEEREEDYVLTPLEEEEENVNEKVGNLRVDCKLGDKEQDGVQPLKEDDGKSNKRMNGEENNENKYLEDQCLRNEKHLNQFKNNTPPIITVETIS